MVLLLARHDFPASLLEPPKPLADFIFADNRTVNPMHWYTASTIALIDGDLVNVMKCNGGWISTGVQNLEEFLRRLQENSITEFWK